ncbi:MAG TPA: ABC transporter substrate-binding protein [Negativicutes bacterium]|jgi:ABC-type nitrate/sulfonate/bicarbonate transport system substrate-binding protein
MGEKFNFRIMAVAVMLTISLLFVFGCSKGDKKEVTANSSEKKYDVLRIPSITDVRSTADVWVGEELGFFDEQGIKFEYVGVIPSTQLVASVVAGKIDIGGAHINRTIAGISAGAKIKAVVGGTETTKDTPHMVYITLANSPLRTPQDLVGKKIGLSLNGGCHEYTPLAYLKNGGITEPSSKVQFTVLAETLMEQALRQGDIDVAGFHRDPWQIAANKEFRVMFSDYDVWQDLGGETPTYFSEKFIKENPDVVKRYVAAMAKTHNWINANPDKAAEITAKRGKVDSSKIKRGYYTPNGLIREQTVTIWIDLLKDFGEIKGDIRPDQIYTNEFNPYYKK